VNHDVETERGSGCGCILIVFMLCVTWLLSLWLCSGGAVGVRADERR
jgi:hypothetical protein